MKLKLLSPNLILLLQEILKNQNLCKLINYNVSNPYTQPNVSGDSLILNKVFPFPFDLNATTTEGTQLRVYYQSTIFKNAQVVENSSIFFDIICSKSKSIWLINDGSLKIRPYEIASELASCLSDRHIDTLGTISFNRIVHVNVNENFDCIRVIGDTYSIGG